MTTTHFEISIIVEAETEEEAEKWLLKHGDFDISDIAACENDEDNDEKWEENENE